MWIQRADFLSSSDNSHYVLEHNCMDSVGSHLLYIYTVGVVILRVRK